MIDCSGRSAVINTMLKAKNFSGAFIQWGLAEKCLTESEDLYPYGEKILQYKIDNAASADEKKSAVSALLQLYADQNKNFPANKNGNAVKTAMLMHKHDLGKPEAIYVLLKEAFANDRSNFSDANALYVYFGIFYKKYEKGEKETSLEDVFALRDNIVQHVAMLRKNNISGHSDYKAATDGINALIAPIATCDKLLPFYQKSFEANKNDKAWLEHTTLTLAAKNCTSAPFFLEIAAQWHLVNPDAKSAYNLAMAHLRNRNHLKAAEFFTVAIELENNPAEKARTAYTIATINSSKKEEAVKFLKKAITFDATYGKPYLFLAQLYAGAGTECTFKEFEKKAVFLLAAQTAEKAAVADKSLKGASKHVSDMYRQKAPTAEEIKQSGNTGKKIVLGCWINETIVFPGK